MKVVIRPAARRDILLQAGYYIDEHALDAAERFHGRLKRQLTNSVSNRGSERPDHPTTRNSPVSALGRFRVSRTFEFTIINPKRTWFVSSGCFTISEMSLAF